jgi:hypothetical protein
MSQIFRKIPFFALCSPSQMQAILPICESRSYDASEVVCKKNEVRNNMHVFVYWMLATKNPVTPH